VRSRVAGQRGAASHASAIRTQTVAPSGIKSSLKS
jgi:hypothetical protein